MKLFGKMKILEILRTLYDGPLESHGWRKRDGVKSGDAITFARPLSLVLTSLSFMMGFLLFLAGL